MGDDQIKCPVCGWVPPMQSADVVNVHLFAMHIDEAKPGDETTQTINGLIDDGVLAELPNGNIVLAEPQS